MSDDGRMEGVGTTTPLIAAEEILRRQERARDEAAQRGYAALLVVGRSFYDRCGDLAYLTNHFPPFPTSVFSDVNRGLGHAFFLLPVDGDPLLLTDPRGYRRDVVPVVDVRRASNLDAAVVEALRERRLSTSKLGLVGDDILPSIMERSIAAALPGLELVPERDLLPELRRIKSRAEQDLLREAAKRADAGLRAAIDTIGTGGATEQEVCAAGTGAALRAGADFVRYLRVHSGPWSAAGSRWPQAMPRVIEPGDVVAMDIIGAFGGYQFDVLRTTVAALVDQERRAMLDLVQAASERAVAACVAGATAGEVVAAAAKTYEGSPFAAYTGPMMGHGIGLETVEAPYLQHGSPERLEPGMVLCVEPGIFVPDWAGASIEQEVIIRPDGPPEVITPTAARLW
ncbi:MAG: Xaa-Pro peptidase family protein [Chloroflexota bacterium]|nr:Xaa-Pro peptidase family protein [Chloroflexota bacterium]